MSYPRTAEQRECHRLWQVGYRSRNRATINAKMREYTKRPEVKVQRREYYRANTAKMLLTEARKRARQKGLAFAMTEADVTIPTVCPVLGIPIIVGGPRQNWPSLDRMNNALGYILGNVFVISHRANNLKSDATAEEVERILAYMRADV